MVHYPSPSHEQREYEKHKHSHHHGHKRRSVHHTAQPQNTLLKDLQIADEVLSKEIPDVLNSEKEIHGATELMITGLPTDLKPIQLENVINILMYYFRLTTAPGSACVKVTFSSDLQSIIAEFRTKQETTNALGLDGFSVFNNNIHVVRIRSYDGPDTDVVSVNPNYLLDLITGYTPDIFLSYARSQGTYFMKNMNHNSQYDTLTIHKPGRTEKEGTLLPYNLNLCILMSNIPKEFEDHEIHNICEPFGDIKGLYLLKTGGDFLGEAVVEYSSNISYEIAMEGLESLPLDSPVNKRLMHISKPTSKWPALPKIISTVSNPSPVLRIGNVISTEDIETDETYEILQQDLLDELKKLGTVLSFIIPRPKHGQLVCDGLGYAFIQYSSLFESAHAARELRTRTFSDHQLHVDYYPEESYINQNFGEAGELI